MFRHKLTLGSRPRLLLGIVILAGVLAWCGKSRQHALDNRLIRAVRDGELASVESRLREGACPNALEDSQPSPFSSSSVNIWLRFLGWLRHRPPPQLNVLEIALADRRWLVAERLIKEGATVPFSGLTVALTRAASGGADSIVEHLLQKGAKINDPDDRGCAPLWYAVAGGHSDIVEKLLDRGAKIALVNPTAGTVTAITRRPPGCSLTRLVWNTIPLERRAAVLTALLGKGLDIDLRLENGRTMLMEAIQRRDVPFVEFLIEHGAKLDLLDENGNTARSQAKKLISESRNPIAPALLDRIEERQ